jgi:hypothetical protein
VKVSIRIFLLDTIDKDNYFFIFTENLINLSVMKKTIMLIMCFAGIALGLQAQLTEELVSKKGVSS